MTWYFDSRGQPPELHIWDHTQNPKTDDPLCIIGPDEWRQSWSGSFPDPVKYDVMYEEAKNEGRSERGEQILRDAIFEKIERADV